MWVRPRLPVLPPGAATRAALAQFPPPGRGRRRLAQLSELDRSAPAVVEGSSSRRSRRRNTASRSRGCAQHEQIWRPLPVGPIFSGNAFVGPIRTPRIDFSIMPGPLAANRKRWTGSRRLSIPEGEAIGDPPVPPASGRRRRARRGGRSPTFRASDDWHDVRTDRGSASQIGVTAPTFVPHRC